VLQKTRLISRVKNKNLIMFIIHFSFNKRDSILNNYIYLLIIYSKYFNNQNYENKNYVSNFSISTYLLYTANPIKSIAI